MVQKPPSALPSQLQPMVTEDLLPTEAWWGYFNNLTSGATPFIQLNVTASPFKYIAIHAGNIVIVGGVVQSVGMKRGRVTIPSLGLVAGPFPVSQNDQLIVTYTGLPVLWFVPNGNPA